jgi:hypothetical protein
MDDVCYLWGWGGWEGQIPLQQIVDCEYLPDKRIGCRFDIRVRSATQPPLYITSSPYHA